MPWIFIKDTNWLADKIAHRLRRELRVTEGNIMATIEEVNTALTTQWETVSPALQSVQERIRALADALASGATTEQLASLVTEVNNNTSRIAEGLRAAMQDPSTPDPTVPIPDPENPLPLPEGTQPQDESTE